MYVYIYICMYVCMYMYVHVCINYFILLKKTSLMWALLIVLSQNFIQNCHFFWFISTFFLLIFLLTLISL